MISLVQYEWKKAFRKKSLLFMLIIFMLIDIMKIFSSYHQNSYLVGDDSKEWSTAFWMLYSDYKGSITSEKIENLLELYNPLQEKIAEMTANTEVNMELYMTGTAYSDYNFLNRYYVTPIKYFYLYEQNARQVCLTAAENAKYYNDIGNVFEARKNTEIYYLFQNRKITDFAYLELQEFYLNYHFSDILILLFILYGISGIYGCEEEGKMNLLLLTNKNGRKKTEIAKIIATATFVITTSLLFSMVDHISFVMAAGTNEGMNMPLYAISFMSETPLDLSIGQYLILSAVTKAVGFLILGLCILAISKICKNSMFSFSIGLIVSTIAALYYEAYYYSESVWKKIINPFMLIENSHLFENTEFVSIIDNPVLGWKMAFVIAFFYIMIITMLLVWLAKNNEHCGSKKCMR